MGWVNRRSTSTTTVFVFLSLTTTPCSTRFGMSSVLSLCLCRLAALLVHDRLNARDIPPHDADPTGALELSVRPLKAQIELLLFEFSELGCELVGTLRTKLIGSARDLRLGD